MSLFKEIARKIKSVTRIKSTEEKILEMKVQIKTLATQLDGSIINDMAEVRKARSTGKSNVRAETRVKNAYYARLLMDQAKDELDDVVKDAQLAKVVNKSARILARLNLKADFSPKIGERFLNWQAEILKGYGQKLPEIKTAEDIQLPDTIIERFMEENDISGCIAEDRIELDNMGYTPDGINFGEYTPENGAMPGNINDDYQKVIDDLKNGR